MTKADQIIKAAEQDASEVAQRLGYDSATRNLQYIGALEYRLRRAYELLFQASRPEGCTEVNACGITAGALPIVNDDNELDGWAIYIGSQCVDDVLDRKVRDKLCDEAERIALDGEAA